VRFWILTAKFDCYAACCLQQSPQAPADLVIDNIDALSPEARRIFDVKT
jgi:hypothetical protein